MNNAFDLYFHKTFNESNSIKELLLFCANTKPLFLWGLQVTLSDRTEILWVCDPSFSQYYNLSTKYAFDDNAHYWKERI